LLGSSNQPFTEYDNCRGEHGNCVDLSENEVAREVFDSGCCAGVDAAGCAFSFEYEPVWVEYEPPIPASAHDHTARMEYEVSFGPVGCGDLPRRGGDVSEGV
jgi:hypothetical protein